jgi:hypothetical protein
MKWIKNMKGKYTSGNIIVISGNLDS